MHLWPTRFALICLVLIHLPCNPVDAGERLSMLDNQLLFDFESSREVPSAQCALGLPASTRGDSLVCTEKARFENYECVTIIPRQVKNLLGIRFGKLVVVGYSGTRNQSATWIVKCDCGKYKVVLSSNLASGDTTSCGCYQREITSKNNSKDLSGKRFGKWRVIRRSHKNKTTNEYMWIVECDCGKTKTVGVGSLNSGASKSCGCVAVEKTILRNRVHSGRKSYCWNNLLTDKDRNRRRLGTEEHINFISIAKHIRKRDGYFCRVCGKMFCMLHVHHIEPWCIDRSLRYEKSNLITLCKDCHVEFHSLYGPCGDYYDFVEYISEIQNA